MRDFWNENRKTVSKLILNQFGAAFMGLLITAAASSNETLMLFASLFSSVFYWVLLYSVIWDKGGQERIRIDGGRAQWKPWNGLKMSLLANIPNFVFGILICVGYIFGRKDGAFAMEWAGNLYAVSNMLGRVWNGMYIGLIQYFSPYNPLIHLLDILPALCVCTLGYYLGLKNRRILGFLELRKPAASEKNKSRNTQSPASPKSDQDFPSSPKQ